MIAMDPLALTRLLQLASPTLPVGAYSYSQGLESAIEDGIVKDAGSAASWIRDVLRFSVGSFEAPLLWRMSGALADDDYAEFARWNTLFRSGRETAELRAETLQMGHALIALLKDLPFCNTSGSRTAAQYRRADFSSGIQFCRAWHAGGSRRGAGGLSLELAREPGHGGAEGGAAGPERGPAHAREHRRGAAGSRATRDRIWTTTN